jgi:1-acyl-sn-glycerol-3-phosphate acyltransferase
MPHESRGRTTPAQVRTLRLVRLVWHLLKGCAISALVFPFIDRATQLRIIKRWSRGVLNILHVRVHVEGTPPTGSTPTVLVSNHVSWLDIWLIHSVSPVRFVAKSDIRRWPLVGWLVTKAGTIFIEREKRHDTARTNRRIIDTLTMGERVGIFPEGTTTDGSELKPFHASLFQPALGAGARIAAVALRYPAPGGGPNLDAAYSGDRSLLESLRLILRHRSLRAEVIFAGVVDVSGKTRREIARETEALIAQALALPIPGRRPGRSVGPRAVARSGADPTGSPYPGQTDRRPASGPVLTSVRR